MNLPGHLPHAGSRNSLNSDPTQDLQGQIPGSLGGHSFLRSETREVRLRSGETLLKCGDPLIGIVTVRSGRLKRYRIYQSEPFLSGLMAPGETAGLREMLGQKTKHIETLEAVGETIVVIEAVRGVQSWLNSVPPFVLAALRGAISQPEVEIRLKRPIELLPVRARVAATLWVLAARHGRVETTRDAGPTVRRDEAVGNRPAAVRIIDLNLTREEIAHLAGTVYESVIRTLTGLKKEGVIDLQGRVIRILEEDQLARIGHIAGENTEKGLAAENVLGESHDQNTVVKNHNSSNNSSSSEAS